MLVEDLKLILKVAEFRSITTAAAKLNMRAATASTAIKCVEAVLGAKLFRHLRLSAAGKGLAVKSCIDISDDLLSGRVVRVMQNYPHLCAELWLICPSRQSITPAVRLVRDVCREKTKAILNQLIEKGILDQRVLETWPRVTLMTLLTLIISMLIIFVISQ